MKGGNRQKSKECLIGADVDDDGADDKDGSVEKEKVFVDSEDDNDDDDDDGGADDKDSNDEEDDVFG